MSASPAAASPRWMGKCPDCNAWNTMVEEQMEKTRDIGAAKRGSAAEPLLLGDIQAWDEDRFVTKIGELDRVLGGGIVAGSVVLIGGDPGIGKSTLVLQMLRQVSELRGKALYVSGEESPAQIKMRAAPPRRQDRQPLRARRDAAGGDHPCFRRA